MTTNNIRNVRAIFKPDNLVNLKEVTPTFFPELDAEYDSFKDHVLVSQFSFTENWPTWEVHPNGDEMVVLMDGETDLVLANEDGSETVMHVSEPGDYVIIPKGSWHTARPSKPTSMLFITPGEGTLNALEPGGDPL